jgi:hypothetical protein
MNQNMTTNQLRSGKSHGPIKLSFEEKLAQIDKQRVKKTRRPKLPKYQKKKGVYDMTLPIRGRCLIIANSVFKKMNPSSNLMGYCRDAAILDKVFTELNFKVHVSENKSVARIKKLISSFSRNKIREGLPNAFVLIILSHGDNHGVLGKHYESRDKTPEEILKVEEIVELLNNQNCEYLKDRPKLVFIQACRGGKYLYLFRVSFI